MLLEQSFSLPFSVAQAWPAFADVPLLVSCMPGASLQGEPRSTLGGEDIALTFTVKLGPIVGGFQGQGEIRRDDASYSGSFAGSGADRKSGSRVKGEAKFFLETGEQNDTLVRVVVDYSLTGALAQFSRGAIVKELASALTREFAQNLKLRMAERQSASLSELATQDAKASEVSTGSVNATIPTNSVSSVLSQPEPLDATRLFWRAFFRPWWARVTAWLGRNPS
jgi:uncharacterized protein